MSAAKRFKPSDQEEFNELERFQLLPDHVWSKAFSYLDNRSKFNVALTCRRFNEIVKSYPEVYKTFQIKIVDPVDCRELRKIDSRYLHSFRIPTITRPIPNVRIELFHFPDLLSKIPGLFESLISFFISNGKFVTNLSTTCFDIDIYSLSQILNEIPNAKKLKIVGSVVGSLKDFEVKSKFKKLKLLDLDFFFGIEDSSIRILEKFFASATNVSILKLSHAFNLLYNKPKLETAVFSVKDPAGFLMDSPSEQMKIFRCVKNLEFYSRFDELTASHGNQKNLERFIKSQVGIEFFSVEQFEGNCVDFLNNLIQHVISLHSLKRCELHDFFEGQDTVALSKCSTAEELKISSSIDIVLPFFPHLKRLFIRYPDEAVDFQVINALKLLEDLIIVVTQHETNFEKIKPPNLKKITFGGNDDIEESTVHEMALKILKNNPNIEEFTLSDPIEINDRSIAWQKEFLAEFGGKKLYACMPTFNETRNHRFLDVFVNEGGNLEMLRFYVDELNEEMENSVTQFFGTKNLSTTFEFCHLENDDDIPEYLWKSTLLN